MEEELTDSDHPKQGLLGLWKVAQQWRIEIDLLLPDEEHESRCRSSGLRDRSEVIDALGRSRLTLSSLEARKRTIGFVHKYLTLVESKDLAPWISSHTKASLS